ncbi:hypothetical protein LTR78_003019 [Recurvomyces mirabilis]|uniref:beta-glucosidase n=1 Tax=Recurvomyces mirabilis TaxID=574656 RepID=A0AAE0WRP8_9PEZI|nr:hypothetical protein LTR78_003019 [Recurvomyces mirabilis]KAK5157161.1 hypothetical protein LTS14_004679 [Recurvomyces mirabilis]
MMFTTQLLAVGLAFIEFTSGQNISTAALANLERYWSYGRSTPVYPTPQSSGLGEWSSAYAKAKALVSQMSNYEKNNITYGQASTTGCSGVSGSVPRLGFPGLCLADSGNGVHAADGVNGWPSAIHVGAAWNRDLAHDRALYMGAEFKNKGVSVALGPVVGPLGKLAKGGRNWEGFSNDPYLAGKLAYETVLGLEKNVMSCVKHFIGNEQETNRNPPILIPTAHNQSLSSNIDPRTEHELYIWPFQDAIRAGAGSVMCSYNRYNNSYGCQNSYSQNGLLKGELGFQGFVVSDWGAQHSGVASADAGLDMAMPSSAYWQNGNLSKAVTNGTLDQSRLDDIAVRIVSTWYRLEEVNSPAFSNPGFGLPASLNAPHTFIDARDPASEPTNLQGAIEGHVLVKNVANTLPLSKPKLLSLFGYDAVASTRNTPNSGTKWGFGLDNTQVYSDGTVFNDTFLFATFLSSEPAGTSGPSIALNGTVLTGGGSGATTPAYIDAPFDAFQRQAYQDRTLLEWNFADFNLTGKINPASEHCIVFINAQSSEGWDRADLADQASDDLVNYVASQCNSTIVVIHSAGLRLVENFVHNPNVTAIMYAHLPGQDSGRALIEVMYGNQSPSGRLPYTVAAKATDYGNLEDPIVPVGVDYYTQDNYTEGVYIDYKHFIAQNITPRFEFGYGLTYTTFSYSDIKVSTASNASLAYLAPNSTLAEGGLASLWDTVATVTISVTNTGSVEAAEVAQLYVGIPGGPQKVLRGFGKETLKAGESCTFTFELGRRDLSTWTSQGWVLQKGTYQIYVGKSVLDIQLTSSLTI